MERTRRLRIAVIGAGASGLMAVIKLREAGFDDVTVFEKASSLGGTWRDNRYPGIACDVPSLAYRYSFAPNAEWSHVFSPGGEILAYLEHIADRHDVAQRVRYESEIVRADYVEGRWRLESVQGDEGSFDAVVTATGILHHPVLPDIPGVDSFDGPSFHTARWDDEVSLAGKRVGIIGTGSTATQIVCAVIDDVEKLSLFQRTPQWIRQLPNKPISREKRDAYRSEPELLEAEYDRLTGWQNTEFAAAVVGENATAYGDLAAACEEYLATVRDPDLRRRLTPDYKVGCKRLVMSDGFYEAVQQPQAELVTEGIEAICPAGVRTRDGRLHALDVLVFATGFDAHGFVRPMNVSGRDGLTLDDAWADGNEGYLTVMVPGFPNWFMIGGPNSPIGNFSWLQTAERQFGFALQIIRRIAAGELSEAAPKASAARVFNDALRDQLPHTVWASGCRSWYMDPHGRIASWPWTFDKFEADMKAPRWEDFELA